MEPINAISSSKSNPGVAKMAGTQALLTRSYSAHSRYTANRQQKIMWCQWVKNKKDTNYRIRAVSRTFRRDTKGGTVLTKVR